MQWRSLARSPSLLQCKKFVREKLCTQVEAILGWGHRLTVPVEVKVLVCMQTYKHADLRACNYLRGIAAPLS